jgi:nitrogen fixation-related uncharacterized protein
MWTYIVVGLIGVAVIAAGVVVGLLAGVWMLKREQRSDLERDHARSPRAYP